MIIDIGTKLVRNSEISKVERFEEDNLILLVYVGGGSDTLQFDSKEDFEAAYSLIEASFRSIKLPALKIIN
jgi:hypothetical protein